MSDTHHLIADQTGERVDAFLARSLPQYSRSFWQKRCEEGSVVTGDKPLKASSKLTEDQEITINLPKAPDFTGQTVPVLYEDDDVIVLNKPAGMLTHAKGALNDEFTIGEYMRTRTTDAPETNRPGIVHRLDRGTSGIIITAKNNEAKRWLQKQFSTRNVKKMYIALVEGHPKDQTADLKLPIERNPRKPQTFRVNAKGKSAETTYEVTQQYPKHSLLQLRPLTGRTHQLRVHMAYLGNPIVGDELYGARKSPLNRFFLHAARLELTLPSRERKVFEAPLPPELQNYLKTL